MLIIGGVGLAIVASLTVGAVLVAQSLQGLIATAPESNLSPLTNEEPDLTVDETPAATPTLTPTPTPTPPPITTTYTGTVVVPLGANIRSGPTSGSARVGGLDYNQSIQIYCYVHGETISDALGTTDIWYSVPGGYMSAAIVSIDLAGVSRC